MNFAEERKRYLEWVRARVIGAGDGGEVRLKGIKPLDWFAGGILFPVFRGEEGMDSEDGDWEEVGIVQPGQEAGAGGEAEPARKRQRYMPPSAAGFSFFISGGEVCLAIEAEAAAYENEGRRDEGGRFVEDRWVRRNLRCSWDELAALRVRAPGADEACGAAVVRRIRVFGGRAGVDVRWRRHRDGWLATVSLFNAESLEEGLTPQEYAEALNARSLFEVALRCGIEAGTVGDYPRVDPALLSGEERELELQYRKRNIHAVGHGAAADWELGDEGEVVEIRTEFMPAVEVPNVTADVPGGKRRALSLDRLAWAAEDPEAVLGDLGEFVDGYRAWVAGRAAEARGMDDPESAGRIVARMETALRRMRGGLEVLRGDPNALRAFSLANRAMAVQMRRARQLRGASEVPANWRPFQLAFLLTTIESVVHEASEFREVMDLIWFPTGGGKTEAYLGLIAFLIVWRRLAFPGSGGGTVALMRYTLRLLTAQQFQRAALLIFALERIRRVHPEYGLGGEPVSLGMWVGRATSPNRFAEAAQCLDYARASGGGAPAALVVRQCPWCGTPFDPKHSYRSSQKRFEFLCRNPKCEFGGENAGPLPCNVVDEALYDNPPSLLIATIDKFARLAWDDRPGAFFGRGGTRPPELVIQDELHLISGALGSVAGLYEAGLETVLVNRGVRPKYIASTATIRMAGEQVRRLYGKDVAVFPPPGLDCDDSYFARTVPTSEQPGRLYVGYFAPGLDRRHCLAPLAGALMAAPELVFGEGTEGREDLLDAWWTLVVYHGSIKGVGISHNAFETEVRKRAALLRQFAGGSEGRAGSSRPGRPRVVEQLTSQSSAERNSETFARLEARHGRPGCIDAVLATNMISVGLDVSRLALMVVNGQPLTTGEYIQSSSRVGRGAVPGLVFVNFYRDQARSLSHFEHFRAYHESFYRFVEPSSVTPFTHQARGRALHAALVLAMRHSGGRFAANAAAGDFRKDDEFARRVLCELKRRCERAGADAEVGRHLDGLAGQWEAAALDAANRRRGFFYQQPGNTRNAERLLCNPDDEVPGLWITLQSMRNVEQTALLREQ